jgi:hypothetical protein
MCNTSAPLIANLFQHDNPALDNLREGLMAENPAVKQFLQQFEAGELAQEELHEEQLEASLAELRGTANPGSTNCELQGSFPQLLQRV